MPPWRTPCCDGLRTVISGAQRAARDELNLHVHGFPAACRFQFSSAIAHRIIRVEPCRTFDAFTRCCQLVARPASLCLLAPRLLRPGSHAPAEGTCGHQRLVIVGMQVVQHNHPVDTALFVTGSVISPGYFVAASGSGGSGGSYIRGPDCSRGVLVASPTLKHLLVHVPASAPSYRALPARTY